MESEFQEMIKKSGLIAVAIIVALMAGFSLYRFVILGGKIIKVEANPQQGFFLEYLLFVPDGAEESRTGYLLVEPNNTGTGSDDHEIHVRSAKNLMEHGPCNTIARELKIPLIVPVFDRPGTDWQLYTHSLDRDTLLKTDGKLARIDLQLISMIKDARQRLEQMGIHLESKVFLHGFSASGSFTNRFTALHPEIVRAVASGGVNCMPVLPVAEWEGEDLIYPLGVSDIDKIANIRFLPQEYKKIPQYIYMGYLDDNDTLPFGDAFSNRERELIRGFLGVRMKDRWEKSKLIYQMMDIPAQMVMYNGTGHEIKREMVEDIISFFKENRSGNISFIEPHKYPFAEFKELETVRIKGAYWSGDKDQEKFISLQDNQFLLLINEWIKNRGNRQLDEFAFRLSDESKSFVLEAVGKEPVKCTLTGSNFSKGDGTCQGYVCEIPREELGKMETGVPYSIRVTSDSDVYKWSINNRVTITRTK